MPLIHSLCISPQPCPLPTPKVSCKESSSSSTNVMISTKPPINNIKLLQRLNMSSVAGGGGGDDDGEHEQQQAVSLELKEKIICLEVMGVDSGRALSVNPSLRTASLLSIHSVISYLGSKGIHHKDLARIFGMCPSLLTSDVRTKLAPVFEFLAKDLGVPDSKLRKAINKCPRLLACSVREQLKPALFYLRRLGFSDLHALAYQDSILLVSSVEKTLIPKLDYLVSLGYSRAEAVGMVLRCPGLFTFSVQNNFEPKFGYYMQCMDGTLEELKAFPQYFGFSLDKRIVPRHQEMVGRGLRFPLPLMLKTTDQEFHQLLCCSSVK